MATFLTPRQVAERWGCSVEHVQRLCKSGALRAMRLGRRGWRIPLDALAAYEAGRTTEPVAEIETRTAARIGAATTANLGPLPDGYEPRFPEAWGLPSRTTGAAQAADGRGRSPKTKKAAPQRH